MASFETLQFCRVLVALLVGCDVKSRRTKIDIILNMRLLLAMIPMLPMTVFAVTVGPLQAGRLEVR